MVHRHFGLAVFFHHFHSQRIVNNGRCKNPDFTTVSDALISVNEEYKLFLSVYIFVYFLRMPDLSSVPVVIVVARNCY